MKQLRVHISILKKYQKHNTEQEREVAGGDIENEVVLSIKLYKDSQR